MAQNAIGITSNGTYIFATQQVCSFRKKRWVATRRAGEHAMPKVAEYRLTWSSEREVYELREHRSQQLLAVTPGGRAWFAWLDSVPSFTFQGQHGQLTVRKESRQRADRYWYAYHRVGEKMVK